MGATTFSIGDADYAALSRAPGKYAMEIKVSAPNQMVKEFHVPGTDGCLLIYCGRTGGKIIFRARYVGTRSTILDTWKADRDAWTVAPVDVIDDEGTTYEQCVLLNAEIVGKMIGTAPSDVGYFDVVGVLDWKGS